MHKHAFPRIFPPLPSTERNFGLALLLEARPITHQSRALIGRYSMNRHRIHAPIGKVLYRRLERWAAAVVNRAEAARPEMPAGIEDRTADAWEPLLTVADLAGGKWPDLARKSAVALVAAAVSDVPQSLNIRLLLDLRTIFVAKDAAVQATTPKGLPTKLVLEALHELEDAPWSYLKEPLNNHSLARRLTTTGIRPDKLRSFDQNQCKSYRLVLHQPEPPMTVLEDFQHPLCASRFTASPSREGRRSVRTSVREPPASILSSLASRVDPSSM